MAKAKQPQTIERDIEALVAKRSKAPGGKQRREIDRKLAELRKLLTDSKPVEVNANNVSS